MAQLPYRSCIVIFLSIIASITSTSVYGQGVGEIRDTLKEAVVRAGASINKKDNIGLQRIDKSIIDNGFALFSGPDVIKTLQDLPGVSSGTELFSGLYVHGGDGTDNVYLLDGVPIYQTGHLGGIFSAFNPDAIDYVDFYKSGFPSKYGGRLSSVVDVRTGDADFEKYHGSVSIALLDGRIHFEGPVVRSKLSCAISLRRSWIDAFAGPILGIVNSGKDDELSGTYKFYDLNAKLTYKIGLHDKLALNYYKGYDKLRGNETKDEPNDGLKSMIDMHFGWGNAAECLSYRHSSLSNMFTFDANVYSSSSRSIINLLDSKEPYSKDNEIDRYYYHERSNHKVQDLGASINIGYAPSGNHFFELGGTIVGHVFLNEGNAQIDSTIANTHIVDKSKEFSAFVEHKMTLSNFHSSAGARWAVFESGGKVYSRVEPRFSIVYVLTPTTTVSASYTMMTQFHHLVSSSYLDLPTNMWMPSYTDAKPMESNQVTVGISQIAYNDIVINIDGWWKNMTGMLLYDGVDPFFPPLDNWDSKFYRGNGKSYGVEMSANIDKEVIKFNIGYTLSWSKRFFKDIWNGWFYDHLDSRNKITASFKWSPNNRFNLSSTWNYHTGFRFSMPTHFVYDGMQADSISDEGGSMTGYEILYSCPNNVRLPDYHRLDIGCNFRKQFQSGRERVWNISVYNVYCRLNPLFMAPFKQGAGNYVGKAYAIIPIIPSVGYSYKF